MPGEDEPPVGPGGSQADRQGQGLALIRNRRVGERADDARRSHGGHEVEDILDLGANRRNSPQIAEQGGCGEDGSRGHFGQIRLLRQFGQGVQYQDLLPVQRRGGEGADTEGRPLGGEQEFDRGCGAQPVIAEADLRQPPEEVMQANRCQCRQRRFARGGLEDAGEFRRQGIEGEGYGFFQPLGLDGGRKQVVAEQGDQSQQAEETLLCSRRSALLGKPGKKAERFLYQRLHIPAGEAAKIGEVGRVATLCRDGAGHREKLEILHDAVQKPSKVVGRLDSTCGQREPLLRTYRPVPVGPDNDLPTAPGDEVAQTQSAGAVTPDLEDRLGLSGGQKQAAAGHEAVAVDPEDQRRPLFAPGGEQAGESFHFAKRGAAQRDQFFCPDGQLLGKFLQSRQIHVLNRKGIVVPALTAGGGKRGHRQVGHGSR